MTTTADSKAPQKRFTAQRRDRIVQLVQENGFLSAPDAAQLLGVSSETIRKDIIELDREGLIRRSRGGAMPVNVVRESPLVRKRTNYPEEKVAIARAAVDTIPAGSSVILDAGSTIYAAAKCIARRSDLCVFTNSIVAIDVLSESDNEVFILGGRVRKSSLAIVGDWPKNELASISADYALLGADSVGSANGPSTNSYEEVAIKRSIIASAKRKILLADKSKFQLTGSFKFCSWDTIDEVVTNEGADVGVMDEIVPITYV